MNSCYLDLNLPISTTKAGQKKTTKERATPQKLPPNLNLNLNTLRSRRNLLARLRAQLPVIAQRIARHTGPDKDPVALARERDAVGVIPVVVGVRRFIPSATYVSKQASRGFTGGEGKFIPTGAVVLPGRLDGDAAGGDIAGGRVRDGLWQRTALDAWDGVGVGV